VGRPYGTGQPGPHPAQAGDPHARLYATPQALPDIVNGNNGGYDARPGWDACTGLGMPHGDATLAALQP
jgi:kumamolisin